MTLAATSRAAYQSVEESGARVDGCKRVMLFLHRDPAGDYTRAEIAQGAGMKLQTVCARVRDLLDDELQRIEELPARACRVTGNPSKPVRVRQSKTAAPAPTARGESAIPAAQPATGKPATLPAIANVPPVAAVPIPSGASAIEIARIRAAQAQANRQAMPTVTAGVDAFRRIFEDAKVVYAHESGHTVGRPGPEGVAASDSRKGVERERRA